MTDAITSGLTLPRRGRWTGKMGSAHETRRLFPWLLIPTLWFFSVGVYGQSIPSAASEDQARSIEALVAPPRDSWPTNGGNIYNQRYSPLDEINRETVGDLGAVWRLHLEGSGVGQKYSGEAQPIVSDGVIYIVTGANDVFAIDIDSGQIHWRYNANLDPDISPICCGWTSRGVGLGNGKVYVGQLDGQLIALDQQTGKLAWSVQAARWEDGYSITSAPLYFDGLVITGFAGAEYGIRGRVSAFHAADGSPAWVFHTVPGPGEVGHDTWPQDNDVWMHGGASVWQTPAVDPELGLLYFSTGNPGPDFNGAVRAGDNLFSVSIVAIDVATGDYRWHFQQVHHDLWDYDSPSPVVLFDVEIDGVVRKALAEASKTGWVYILDRTNGEPLIGIEERPVPQEPRQATAATQPYPIGDAIVPQSIDIAPEGYTLVNGGRIFTPFWTEGVVAKPSPFGGINWPPPAYDPATATLYVCANDRTQFFNGGDRDFEIAPNGARYIGGTFASVPMPSTGIFAAVDMTNNRLVWRQQWADLCYSGSLATAGGLVFVGRNDGRLTALDSSNGRLLWEFQTGAGSNSGTSTFEHNGEQHLVSYSAGNLFAGSPRGDSVWLFSLSGTREPAQSPALAEQPPAPDRQADVNLGRQVFVEACGFCHGPNGDGGHGGPALNGLTDLDLGVASLIVTEGGADMPALGSSLTSAEIQDVAAYLVERLIVR
ncbi:MAG: PQQ-binding-like beta-propeller repeat protein [Acidobacteriota bacterium]|nr:PQQ-binding-like beta-propeller repeat protein [Acidobacteriota bacterium]